MEVAKFFCFVFRRMGCFWKIFVWGFFLFGMRFWSKTLLVGLVGNSGLIFIYCNHSCNVYIVWIGSVYYLITICLCNMYIRSKGIKNWWLKSLVFIAPLRSAVLDAVDMGTSSPEKKWHILDSETHTVDGKKSGKPRGVYKTLQIMGVNYLSIFYQPYQILQSFTFVEDPYNESTRCFEFKSWAIWVQLLGSKTLKFHSWYEISEWFMGW